MEDGDANRLPVFLSVSEIEFPVTELSPRRIITVYNPYGYPIQYKVLCNAPGNYSVPNSKGILHAKSCKDLVVKCTAKLSVGTTDRLRVEIMRLGETEVLGSRDLLLRTVSEHSYASPESSSRGSSVMEARIDQGSGRRTNARIHDENAASSQLACLGIAVVCAVALMAPTQGDPAAADSLLPNHLHLTVPQKLVAAYILGVVSILLLRPMT
ncbi:hypothetical protein KIN20_003141 [Parelaphostrongylus tenuis]|uniref:MSP domain-containing protein n=1 Tax=Parelaphostrongylus tenuis TaxID=148309 RepID=A0AAD5QIE4_PARTN|nr:hypothetical protein KIN20_003141 [Parelaphostrongylus tenuis]